MRQMRRSIVWMAALLGALAPPFLVAGCGSFAFYENSKVGITIMVDPKAPDPVELSASFKEAVFALLPVGQDKDSKEILAGPVLSDFDVRYGANAGVNTPTRDFLYAAITHGVATGTAAITLVSRRTSTDQARRVVIIAFLRQLSNGDLKGAAEELKLTGLGTPDSPTLRGRAIEAVDSSAPADLTVIEQALKTKFPSFSPWTQ